MNEHVDKLAMIERWLLEFADGTASPEETDRVNGWLLADAELRRHVRQRLIDDSILIDELRLAEAEQLFHGDSILPQSKPADIPTAPSRARSRWRGSLIGAAAVAALALLVTFSLMSPRMFGPPELANKPAGSSPDGDASSPVFDTEGVALITRSVGVEWGDDHSPARVNDRIAARRLKIDSGLLQLEFFSGATVVIEGPADFEVVSAMRCQCHYGKVRADVPPQATGFTIAGGVLDIVDLGTEFAMKVEPGGEGEVHVLDGQVSIRPALGGESRMLRDGEAVRFENTGELQDMAVDRLAFVNPAQLDELNRQREAETYLRWGQHSEQWARDPDMVLYYNFQGQEAAERRLNCALPDSDGEQAGAIVGCRWTEGRFAGKGALEFKRTSDRVRVNVDGSFESLSLLAWLRIEGFDQWYSSLLLTDGFDEKSLHWQLTQKGLLKLTVGEDQQFATGEVVTPQDLGRWVQIATVYDANAKRVRHYINGEQVIELPIDEPHPLSIGDAEIGNWNSGRSSRNAIRSLNGRLDEFAIFRRALSAEEVRKAHTAGNPYP